MKSLVPKSFRWAMVAVPLFVLLVWVQTPLMSAPCLIDDYPFVELLVRRRYLTETINDIHYLPIQGFLWDFLGRVLGGDHLFAGLRWLHIFFQTALLVTVLHVATRAFPGAWPPLFAVCYAVLHPLVFQVFFYNINMIWTLSLLAQVGAFAGIQSYMAQPRLRMLLGVMVCEMLAVVLNIAGLFVTAAVVAVYWLRVFIQRRQSWAALLGTTMALLAPAVLYAGAYWFFFVSAGADNARVTPSSPGMAIVNSLWLLCHAFLWIPDVVWKSYIAISQYRWFGVPLPAWTLCSGLLALLLFACWRRRKEIYLDAFIFMMAALVIPPKSYVQPRYAFFLLPWVGILTSLALSDLVQLLRLERYKSKILGGFLAIMCVYSTVWLWGQAQRVKVCADYVDSLLQVAAAVPQDRPLVLRNFLYESSRGDPWPRLTFHGEDQLQSALRYGGYTGEVASVTWKSYEWPAPRTPPKPVISREDERFTIVTWEHGE